MTLRISGGKAKEEGNNPLPMSHPGLANRRVLLIPFFSELHQLLCRLRYKLSFRNIAEFFWLRGFELTHENVRDWEERFAPIFT